MTTWLWIVAALLGMLALAVLVGKLLKRRNP